MDSCKEPACLDLLGALPQLIDGVISTPTADPSIFHWAFYVDVPGLRGEPTERRIVFRGAATVHSARALMCQLNAVFGSASTEEVLRLAS